MNRVCPGIMILSSSEDDGVYTSCGVQGGWAVRPPGTGRAGTQRRSCATGTKRGWPKSIGQPLGMVPKAGIEPARL